MNYQLLGNSGLRISELCLGTMTFGGPHAGTAVDAKASREQFDAYRAAGGNFIDTANMYSQGESEKLVAKLIVSSRDEVVLASKYTMSMRTNDPNAGGNQRKNMAQALNASLRRLETDYIDLYWIHANDPHTPLTESLRALDDAVRAGKILYVGISNMPAWRVAQAQMLCRQHGWTNITALQLQYSLIERNIESDFMPMAAEMGIGVTAWSPLGGGVLTGKYASPGDNRGRLDAVPRYGETMLKDRNVAIAQTVAEIAQRHQCSSAQVAIAWLIAKGTIPIVGATSVTQLQDNLGAADLQLTAEDIQELDTSSHVEPTYPHDLWPRISEMQFGKAHSKVVTKNNRGDHNA